jgi:hypothetical protein
LQRSFGFWRLVIFQRAVGLQVAEFALHQFQHAIVRHVACRSYQQMVRRKPFLEAGLQRFTGKLPDGIGSAQNRPAERMLRPKATGENFVQ